MRRTASLLLACAAFSVAGVLPAHADDEKSSSPSAAQADDSAAADVRSDAAGEVAAPADAVATDAKTVDDTPADAAATPVDDTPDSAVTMAQDADVRVVAVAIADSGGNVVTGGDPAIGEKIGAELATGSATATGSEDVTHVAQQATTALSDQATADITQMVVVFNVGIAAATSGGNNGGTGAGGGSIATGDAHAVGNDSSTYLTQGAGASVGDGISSSTTQVAMTVRMGVGIGNSGGNAVAAGSVQAGGSVHTGDATAVGNSSLTDVSQIATLAGSGTAHLTVDQRAMILNLGIALANTGLNELGSAADALLASADQNDAEALLALLLPALLADAHAGSAATSTGSATAIGNSSQTYVSQTAVASASGDGTVAISQQVVVANVGVAVANTGGNDGALGAVDPQAAAQFAAFITQLFDSLNRWQASGSGEVPGNVWLELTFGDTVIRIDGTLSGAASLAGDPQGAHATVRQLSAIISVGVASANSGDNTQDNTGMTAGEALATAVSTTPVMVITGDVDASNGGMTIVCQLANSAIPCLGPPDGPGPVAEDPVPSVRVDVPAQSSAAAGTNPRGRSLVADAAGTLPATGTDAVELLRLAAYLASLGCLLVFLTGRRRAPADLS